uniref:Cytochrome c biogenesis protein transmembrane region n=1 Tax=Porphyridium sordidum TaxID=28024 RepID=A0A1C9CDY7_PORSO|nr:cytochrome c biogenesis protein transmembrane region [Porphyridium sordidum]AOM66600.1 cytochrome c biogenesis protein transmembrane region [Porphyridium sordidum]
MSYNYNLFFQFGYYLESINSYYIDHFNYFNILLLIILGVVSGINPCILSLLPVYNAYLNQEDINAKKKYKPFIIGLYTGIVFVTWLSSTVYSSQVNNHYYYLLLGIAIFSLGYERLGINSLNNYLFSRSNLFKYISMINKKSLFSSYFIGLSLGLTGSSCSTPSIVTLSLWLQNSQDNYLGIFFICLYSLGYVFPIVFSNIILEKINTNMKRFFFNKWSNIISANMLITLGTYYVMLCFDKY